MCPVPPEIEVGGLVYANSIGNRFGGVCRGDIRFMNSTGKFPDHDEPEMLSECPLVSVLNDQNASAGYAKYRH